MTVLKPTPLSYTNQTKQLYTHILFFLNLRKVVKRFLRYAWLLFAYYKLYKYFFLIFSYIVQSMQTKKAYFFSKFHKTKTLKRLKRRGGVFKKYKKLFHFLYKRHKYIYEIFYCVFKYKTLSYLIVWMRKLFKHVNFYKHQNLLYFFRYFFKILTIKLFNLFNVTGLFMKFHGKIAKAGNSRRKKFLIRHNYISTCYENNYLIEKFQIVTFTGAVGCTVILSYKNI